MTCPCGSTRSEAEIREIESEQGWRRHEKTGRYFCPDCGRERC